MGPARAGSARRRCCARPPGRAVGVDLARSRMECSCPCVQRNARVQSEPLMTSRPSAEPYAGGPRRGRGCGGARRGAGGGGGGGGRRPVLASAGNRTRELADPTAHAEMLAIRAGLRGCWDRSGSTAPISTSRWSPARCARRRSRSRASAGSTSAPRDPKGGGVEHGPRIFSQPTCHHAPEVYGGIEEVRAGALLRQFFAEPPLRARLAALRVLGAQVLGAADRHQAVALVKLLQRGPSPAARCGRSSGRCAAPRPPRRRAGGR